MRLSPVVAGRRTGSDAEKDGRGGAGRSSTGRTRSCETSSGIATVEVASGSSGMKFWDPQTGRESFGLPVDVHDMALSPDGHRIAAGTASQVLTVWDVETRQLVLTCERTEGSWFVDFSPRGDRLVAVGGERPGSGMPRPVASFWDSTCRTSIPIMGSPGVPTVAASLPSHTAPSASGRSQDPGAPTSPQMRKRSMAPGKPPQDNLVNPSANRGLRVVDRIPRDPARAIRTPGSHLAQARSDRSERTAR